MTTQNDRDRSPDLTDRDCAVLDFEREWWRYAGAKEQAIREHFDMSASSYYKVLNALIDDEAAMAYDPMLVKRMQRLRAKRLREREAASTNAKAT